MEELSQFDMTVIHHPAIKHGNDDGMSRIPDDITFCHCYITGKEPSQLPCTQDECKYYPRAHNQWSRFNDEVDHVVHLAIKSVKSETKVELPNKWLQHYTNDKLKEAQAKDTNLQKLITWISDDGDPE